MIMASTFCSSPMCPSSATATRSSTPSTGRVDSDQRWVILGPNGAGKTTLLQIAAAAMHPTRGHGRRARGGARQGRRVRAAPDDRLRLDGDGPHASRANETVLDVVLTAAYSVTGRWNEEYEEIDMRRARACSAEWKLEDLADRTFGRLSATASRSACRSLARS